MTNCSLIPPFTLISLSLSLSLSLSIIIACQYVFYNSLIKCGVFGDGKEVYDNL